ncbi:MAG TPA: histidine kinase [Flavilitoribacter sp.]|nr:histidine kinase [Flavilitoribacter sp.]HMQ90950.1 histidine kinase [Flavilitoribacter sp.]
MKTISNIIRNRGVQHLAFWTLSLVVLAYLFAYQQQPNIADWVYALLFHLSIVLAVYLNIGLLIPAYFSKGRYLLYLLVSIGGILAATWFNILFFRYIPADQIGGFYFIAYYGFWDILLFMVVYWVLSSLLKLSKSWFLVREKDRKIDRLKKDLQEIELQNLKSQLNPHFLLNSLNGIYSLALDQDQRTAKAILMLSQNLRFTLYECNTEFIPLEQELNFLQNYLDLQRLRLENRAMIGLELTGNLEDRQVPPLLFLPLVENAFKHGLHGDQNEVRIRIECRATAGELNFRIENTTPAATATDQTMGGVGLENVRKRLNAIYPDRHRLVIDRSTKGFSVDLLIC